VAQKAIDDSRAAVARVLGCRTSDVVFTSGGTESINAALRGVAFAQVKARAGNQIITTAVEHDAVRHTCSYLEQYGFEVTYLPVDAHGSVSPDDVVRAMTDRTVLVSVMLANNEVGTVQAPGLLPLNVDALGVDLLSLSGHKFGGPKGSGVLYIRRGVPYAPQQTGGGQERQRRAGTENVAGAVGLATALQDAESSREAAVPALAKLRDRLIEAIIAAVPGVHLNGHPSERLANNVNVSVPGVRGDDLVLALDKLGVAASAGAACGSQTWEPSHVLLAMGLSMTDAVGGLRLTLSAETTEAEIEAAVARLPVAVDSLRTLATAG
jgi:cysteine desulfurase